MSTKLGRGTYTYRDLDTKKIIKVKSIGATCAIRKLNKTAGKVVNYSFISFKKG